MRPMMVTDSPMFAWVLVMFERMHGPEQGNGAETLKLGSACAVKSTLANRTNTANATNAGASINLQCLFMFFPCSQDS